MSNSVASAKCKLLLLFFWRKQNWFFFLPFVNLNLFYPRGLGNGDGCLSESNPAHVLNCQSRVSLMAPVCHVWVAVTVAVDII